MLAVVFYRGESFTVSGVRSSSSNEPCVTEKGVAGSFIATDGHTAPGLNAYAMRWGRRYPEAAPTASAIWHQASCQG